MADQIAHRKLHGRAFYESIGSPKMILAPMVDQSEYAWRMLSRSFMTPESSKDLLAYSPMFHARLFADTPKYRESHFQPIRSTLPSPPDSYHASQHNESDRYLDGNPKKDRPLFVQFCANNPDELLAAAKHVQHFCDAVDLNLGCPQGIAKKGHYGAFLQEDWDLIYELINKLHLELDIPVTAKMRVLETKEKTLEYAKMILSAGASILTVHGRRREQKGHNTGLADWGMLRYLRDNLPPETVMFANGNILQHEDIARCLQETGVDGVMSAEGNLYDPTIFAEPPPAGQEGREYWRGKDGKGGFRMDAVLRRYMDIIYRDVLGQEPPQRKPLFLPSDASEEQPTANAPIPVQEVNEEKDDQKTILNKTRKGNHRKRNKSAAKPNVVAKLAKDALAKSRAGDIAAYENVLTLVEIATKEGMLEYEACASKGKAAAVEDQPEVRPEEDPTKDPSSLATVAKCKRPWFICQPHIRPLPNEAMQKGALSLTKKEKARLEKEKAETREAGLTPGGRVEEEKVADKEDAPTVEVAKEGLVCG
ncbi:tRNA dihydrouridine synthase [Taxawa tesnikishii (nom. ined.)]|nr:tRNA dihydrouridine synthase [Dothideales sp. JES 119]